MFSNLSESSAALNKGLHIYESESESAKGGEKLINK